ncbi:hypothetical protein J4423_03080 [Candidatus Pacearchaeota archaeon]|nr:hypothetical protein [Candidatus Pacearchaeota archaeon]
MIELEDLKTDKLVPDNLRRADRLIFLDKIRDYSERLRWINYFSEIDVDGRVAYMGKSDISSGYDLNFGC